MPVPLERQNENILKDTLSMTFENMPIHTVWRTKTKTSPIIPLERKEESTDRCAWLHPRHGVNHTSWLAHYFLHVSVAYLRRRSKYTHPRFDVLIAQVTRQSEDTISHFQVRSQRSKDGQKMQLRFSILCAWSSWKYRIF